MIIQNVKSEAISPKQFNIYCQDFGTKIVCNNFVNYWKIFDTRKRIR